MNILLIVPFLSMFLGASVVPTTVSAHTTWNYTVRYTHTTPTPPVVVPAPPVVVAPTAPAPTSTQSFADTVESEIHRLINVERVNNHLLPLALDTKLTTIARAHSTDMLVNNYFDHTDLTGCSASCRLTKAGYSWSSMGENIYWMSGYTLTAQQTAKMIVDGWMNSPGHRANILTSAFTNEGIGLAVQGKVVYATEDFARPR